MTLYEFGDVVLVGFPFTNLQTVKKRPAVIVSSHAYQQQRGERDIDGLQAVIQLILGRAV